MQSYEIISDISYNSTPLRERLPWPCLGHSHVYGRRELLHALSGALSRTKAVIVLWDFADPALDVSAAIAKAVGLNYFNISKDPSAPFNLPRGAVPFVGAGASVYGYFLESGRQSIIVLSSLTGAAEFAAGAFLIPYLTARYSGSRSLPAKSAAAGHFTRESAPGAAANAPAVGNSPGEIPAGTGISNIPAGAGIQPQSIPPAEAPYSEEALPDSGAYPQNAVPGGNIPAVNNSSDAAPPQNDTFTKNSPPPNAASGESVSENTAPEPEYTSYEMAPREQPAPADESFPDENSPWEFDYSALENSEPEESSAEENTRKKAPLILKIATIIISLLIILIAGFAIYDFFLSGTVADKIYSKIQTQSSDFAALSKINPDISGWIKIRGTSIDYPVVVPNKKSAGYYTNHTVSGLYNKYGTPSLPEGFSPVDYCRNTVITAKNRGDGRMFSDLEKYLDTGFFEKNSIISYQSQFFTTSWRIIGVSISAAEPGKDEFAPELSKFADDAAFSKYLDTLNSYSLITTDVKLDENDVLFTLITDYSGASGYKIALIARKLRYNETDEDTVEAAANGAVILPGSSGSTDIFDTLPDKLQKEIAAARLTVTALAFSPAEEPEISSSETAEDEIESETYSSAPSSAAVSSSVSSKKISSAAASSKSAVKSSTVPSSKPASPSSAPADSATPPPQTTSEATNNASLTLTVTNQATKTVVTGPAAEIIAQVVEAEMSSSFHIEALKAQAITAYTWILNQGAAPQVPMKTAGANAIKATNEVIGKKVYYGGKPALVYYFAMSAGSTAPNTDTWTKGPSYPYLVSVNSSAETVLPKFQTFNTYKAADVAKWIKAVCKVDLNGIDKNKWFTLTPGQNRLYIKNVNLGGLINISGNELRLNVFNAANAGAGNALRSHAFEVGYSSATDSFTFSVKGYGHGVGMSQEGANLMAKSGKNYNDIIKHYFPGVTIN